MLYTVIMAGGAGTRFWPLSRRSAPKQGLQLIGRSSLFEMALERIARLTPSERTLVITNTDQAALLANQAGGLPRKNIIAEPAARDSAAAVFLGAAIIAAVDEEAVMLVKAADHVISPIEAFEATVMRAVEVAETGHLVTFGVRPRYAATGYGYIERGAPFEGVEGAFRVAAFREKPDPPTAQEYLADGIHYWNSGMFVWRARDILDAARRHAPVHYERIAPLGAAFAGEGFSGALAGAYTGLPKISIDYAVMEKADNIAMVEADFKWDDVGSPVTLRDYLEEDADGNAIRGEARTLDSTGCTIVGDEDHMVAVVGCSDLVVIHTGDATLVCPADRIGDVKRLVSQLEQDDSTRKYI